MHIGASDYIIKDKLSKLPVSILRALKEIEEHQSRVEAETSLKESEARFRDIIMSSYDWVWEIDRNWEYCYPSDAIGNILGYTNEEVIGKSPFDFMPDDEKEIVGPVFSKIVGGKGIIKDLGNWNLHKDGHRVCLLTNGFPIFDDAGNLVGYRGVDKDITKSKNLNIELIRAKEKALEAGCDDYLSKPVKSDLLLSVINKQLGINKL
jgi:PAS domain S-box-containing protein